VNKRFVVLVQSATKGQDDAFLGYIKANKLSWWHWLPNSWLLKGINTELKAANIRDAAREAFTGAHIFVIELNEDGDTWSGFGPKTERRNMFAWIHKSWKDD
jgi:hypothetical protein